MIRSADQSLLESPHPPPARPPRAPRAYVPPVVARTLEDRAAHALAMRERGFTAIKLRAAHATVEEDVAMVQAVRNAVGDTMDILVDANMAAGGRGARPVWDLPRALRTAEELAALTEAVRAAVWPGTTTCGESRSEEQSSSPTCIQAWNRRVIFASGSVI